MLTLEAKTIYNPQGQAVAVQVSMEDWGQILAALEELDQLNHHKTGKAKSPVHHPVIDPFGD